MGFVTSWSTAAGELTEVPQLGFSQWSSPNQRHLSITPKHRAVAAGGWCPGHKGCDFLLYRIPTDSGRLGRALPSPAHPLQPVQRQGEPDGGFHFVLMLPQKTFQRGRVTAAASTAWPKQHPAKAVRVQLQAAKVKLGGGVTSSVAPSSSVPNSPLETKGLPKCW